MVRICSFFPTATELLDAIGAGRQIVGRSQHCNYPPSVVSRPIIVRSRIASSRLSSRGIDQAVRALRRRGEHHYWIDVPLLKRLKPDLVVTQELCSVCAASHPEVIQAIRQLPGEPRTVSVNAGCIDELFRSIATLGRSTGRSHQAAALNARMRREIRVMQRLVRRSSARPRVWCAEWLDPLMAAGHWVPEMVAIAGGSDGLGKPGQNSPKVTWDAIRRYDPEVILVMPCSFSITRTVREFPLLAQRPGWTRLNAVKTGRVFAVQGAFFHHLGPRLISGLQLMASLFHPALCPALASRDAVALVR